MPRVNQPENDASNMYNPLASNQEGNTNSVTKSLDKLTLAQKNNSILEFFNSGAYRARWTKELLEAVSRRPDKDKEKDKGMREKSDSILTTAGKVASTLGVAAIGAAVLASGYREQKDLKEVLGGEKNFQKIADPKSTLKPAMTNFIHSLVTGISDFMGGRTPGSFGKYGQDAMNKLIRGKEAKNIALPSIGTAAGLGVTNVTSRALDYQNKIGNLPTENITGMNNLTEGLSKSIDKLTQFFAKKEESVPSSTTIVQSGNYGTYGSGDPLVNKTNGGYLDND